MELYFHSASVISDMAIGGLAAHLWLRCPRLRGAITLLPWKTVLAAYAGGAILFLALGLGGRTYYDPVPRIVVAVFFAFIVLEQNFCSRSLGKAAQLAWMTRLGRYTYGLYLLHAIVLTLLTRALLAAGLTERSRWYWVVLGPTGLAGSILAAVVSYHVFERRFLLRKNRYTHVPSGVP